MMKGNVAFAHVEVCKVSQFLNALQAAESPCSVSDGAIEMNFWNIVKWRIY